MAKFAYIGDDLSVTRMQSFNAAPDVPTHKKRRDGGLFMRPVVEDEDPAFIPALEQIDIRIAVEATQVRVTKAVVRKGLTDQIAAVKTEAQRRIYERFPQWKQANMTARAVELLRVGETNWSDTEKAEAAALDASWLWIKSIRDASGSIEVMQPIPSDFDAGKWWPA